MKAIGKGRQPSQLQYQEWPVFKEFRKSEEFGQAYKDVFGEEFKLQEQEPRQAELEDREAEQTAELDE